MRHSIAICLFCCLLIVCCSIHTNAQEIPKVCGDAYMLSESPNPDYNLVIDLYTECLSNNLENELRAKIYLNRANAYDEIGQHQPAIKDYSAAEQLGLVHFLLYYNRGYLYEKIQDYERASKDYAKAIQLNPSFVPAYINYGFICDVVGEYDTAIKLYSKALTIDNRSPMIYSHRGIVFHKIGKYLLAIEDYSRAIELNPGDSGLYCNRSYSYHQIEDYKQALMDLEKAISLDPTNLYAYINASWILSSSPDTSILDGPRSVELALTAAEIENGPHALDTLGAAYARNDQFELAVTTQRDAISMLKETEDPDNLLEPFQERLDLYEKGLPYTENP